VPPLDRVLDFPGNKHVFEWLGEPVASEKAIAFSEAGASTMTIGEGRERQAFTGVDARLQLFERDG
jgi:hypothetical protein